MVERMKLIVQSDDYGMTRAVARGCIYGIEKGVVRATGAFMNMPWIEECIEWIKPYLDQISFGIDLNASTGPALLPHDQIPTLTKENGNFYGSKENRAFDTDENDHDHLASHEDELYAEFKAQIEKFIQVVGKKPDYIHNHAYGTKTTAKVTEKLGKEYNIITTSQFMDRDDVVQGGMGWYVFGNAQEQLAEKPIEWLVEDKAHMLDSEIGYVISHCGYVDAELFKLTSFTTCRAIDLDCMTSDEIKSWIKENHIEVVSFEEVL